MIRSLPFGLVGAIAFMAAAFDAMPAVSRPDPTPSIRPPTASVRPLFDIQKGGGGGKGGGFGGGKGFGGGFAPGGGGISRGYYPGFYGQRFGGFGGYYGYGLGIGIGGYPYGYPYSYSNPSLVSPGVEILPLPATETALQIQEIYDGPAKKAALREGDVIIAVGKARVRNFNELVLALANVTGPVDVTYIAGGNGKTEKTTVTPVDGKIGVGVIPVDLN